MKSNTEWTTSLAPNLDILQHTINPKKAIFMQEKITQRQLPSNITTRGPPLARFLQRWLKPGN